MKINKSFLFMLLVFFNFSFSLAAFPGFGPKEPTIKVDPRTIHDNREDSMWWQGTKIVGNRIIDNGVTIGTSIFGWFGVNVKEKEEKPLEEHAIDVLIEIIEDEPGDVSTGKLTLKAAAAITMTVIKVGLETKRVATEFNLASKKKSDYLRQKQYFTELYDKQQVKREFWNKQAQNLQETFEETSWL